MLLKDCPLLWHNPYFPAEGPSVSCTKTPLKGSRHKLQKISCEECDKPKKGVEKLAKEVRDGAEAARYFEEEEYEIWCEFGQGVALPKENEKY